MDRFASVELDPVLHQPVRTRIVAYLATRGEATFTELKRVLDITDGNLEAHIKKLVAARYLRVHKASNEGRPQTTYQLAPLGERRFHSYINSLQSLLKLEDFKEST